MTVTLLLTMLLSWQVPEAKEVLATPVEDIDPRVAKVQESVRDIVEALYRGDVGMIVHHTYPGVVETMGGKEKTFVILRNAMDQMRALGMKLESLEFPEPPIFIEGNGRTFALVPTKAMIESQDQRVESINFQFGIFPDDGDRWTFVEGSRINEDVLAEYFPDFPRETDLPPVSRGVKE